MEIEREQGLVPLACGTAGERETWEGDQGGRASAKRTSGQMGNDRGWESRQQQPGGFLTVATVPGPQDEMEMGRE